MANPFPVYCCLVCFLLLLLSFRRNRSEFSQIQGLFQSLFYRIFRVLHTVQSLVFKVRLRLFCSQQQLIYNTTSFSICQRFFKFFPKNISLLVRKTNMPPQQGYYTIYIYYLSRGLVPLFMIVMIKFLLIFQLPALTADYSDIERTARGWPLPVSVWGLPRRYWRRQSATGI